MINPQETPSLNRISKPPNTQKSISNFFVTSNNSTSKEVKAISKDNPFSNDSPACVAEFITPVSHVKSPSKPIKLNKKVDDTDAASLTEDVCEKLINQSMSYSPENPGTLSNSTVMVRAANTDDVSVKADADAKSAALFPAPSIMQLFDQASTDYISSSSSSSTTHLTTTTHLTIIHDNSESSTPIVRDTAMDIETSVTSVPPSSFVERNEVIPTEAVAVVAEAMSKTVKRKGSKELSDKKAKKAYIDDLTAGIHNSSSVHDTTAKNDNANDNDNANANDKSKDNHTMECEAVIDDEQVAKQLQQQQQDAEDCGGRPRRARKPTKFYDAGVVAKVSYDAQGYEIAPENLEIVVPKVGAKKKNKDTDKNNLSMTLAQTEDENDFNDYYNNEDNNNYDDDDEQHDGKNHTHSSSKNKNKNPNKSSHIKDLNPSAIIGQLFSTHPNNPSAGLAKVSVTEEILQLLSEEGQQRVMKTLQQMHTLAYELRESERLPELCDKELDLDMTVKDLIDFIKSYSQHTATVTDDVIENTVTVISTNEEINTSPPTVLNESEKDSLQVQLLINTLLARVIQGSKLTLSQLVTQVHLTLKSVRNRILQEICHKTTTDTDTDTTITIANNNNNNLRLTLVLSEFQKYVGDNSFDCNSNSYSNSSDNDAVDVHTYTSDKIKLLAERESYKDRAKRSTAYEEYEYNHDDNNSSSSNSSNDIKLLDEYHYSTWRWDVKNNSYFSGATKHAQSVLREVRIHRNKYRKCIKVLHKTLEIIMKAYILPPAINTSSLPSTTVTVTTEPASSTSTTNIVGSDEVVISTSTSTTTCTNTNDVTKNDAPSNATTAELITLNELNDSKVTMTTIDVELPFSSSSSSSSSSLQVKIELSADIVSKLQVQDELYKSLKLGNELRAEKERKRQEELEIKKQKQLMKSEQTAAATTVPVKEVKEKVLSEKELKIIKEKEKQKNLMGAFFNMKKPSTSTTVPVTVTTATVLSLNEKGEIINEEIIQTFPSITNTAITSSVDPTGSVEDNCATAVGKYKASVPGSMIPYQPIRRLLTDKDKDTFFALFKAGNMTLPDISRMNKNRQPYLAYPKSTCRKPLTLSVTVNTTHTAAGFGATAFYDSTAGSASGAQYSQIVQKQVDSRLKHLSFYEDTRPPYYGTYSKRSMDVTGRRPFSLDTELINYDYDSEAEWEEEEEGEDIGMSDDDDDEDDSACGSQDNELEYDEMFLHDNDFGSDVGSDGDAMAKVVMRIREGEEQIGCRYIQSQLLLNNCHTTNNNIDMITPLSSSAVPLVYMYDYDCSNIITSLKFSQGDFISSKTTTTTATNDNEIYDNDTRRLSSYTAVVYHQAITHIPYLSTTSSSLLSVVKQLKENVTATTTPRVDTVAVSTPISKTINTINNNVNISKSIQNKKHQDESNITINPTTDDNAIIVVDNDDHDHDKQVSPSVKFISDDNKDLEAMDDNTTNKSKVNAAAATSAANIKHHEQTILVPLMRFIHGKKDNLDKLVNDFTSVYQNTDTPYSKALTRRTISDIAEKVRDTTTNNNANKDKFSASGNGSPRWIVKNDVIMSERLTDEDRDNLNLPRVVYTPKKEPLTATAKKSNNSNHNYSSNTKSNIKTIFLNITNSVSKSQSQSQAQLKLWSQEDSDFDKAIEESLKCSQSQSQSSPINVASNTHNIDSESHSAATSCNTSHSSRHSLSSSDKKRVISVTEPGVMAVVLDLTDESKTLC